MNRIKNFIKNPMGFVSTCFLGAILFGFIGNEVRIAQAQPAGGYWTPTTVWGNGIAGTSNAFYFPVTNIVRLNAGALRLGDVTFSFQVNNMTSGANSNAVFQLGRSILPVTPTNSAGAGGQAGYPGIDLFTTVTVAENGTIPQTLCTNFGADNAAFGGAQPYYYYVMWISGIGVSAATPAANASTNVQVAVVMN